MQYTHEITVTADAPWREIWAEWTSVHRLPSLLSHICDARPASPDEQAGEDIAHFTILLEGRRVEFAAQRTMCADKTLCWQSLGSLFMYVLSLRLEQPKKGGGVELTLSVAYDPPGFLPDIAESLGLSRRFKHELEADFHRYVHTLQMNCLSELASVE